MRKNDITVLDIGAVSNLGYGVGRIPEGEPDGGMVVFVPGAVSGDRVRAKIIKVTKSYCVARLEGIIKESAEREPEPFCTAPASCGGCAYRFLKYDSELELKRAAVAAEFRKAGLDGVNVLPVLCVRDADGTPRTRGCRNKAQYRFVMTKNGIRAGFYASGTHRVAGYEDCSLHPEVFRDIAVWFCCRAERDGLTVYDEMTGKGLLRHVLVRRGFSTDEIMVVLVIGSPIFPSKNNFVKALRKKYPQITTVVLNVNDKKTSMVLGERDIVIYGKGYIRDTLCGCTFRISPQSFYQVNPVQTEILYKTAIEYAGLGRKETVIDAYCGIGTIGLVAAKRAKNVIGVELNPDAVRDARINAKENKITNARFYQGDAGEFMENMAENGEHADVVFMDPPRTGSDKKFMSSVIKLNPSRIVYISCGPETLARDLEYLTKHGYDVRKIQPVDMFSFTDHCENICLLTKKFEKQTKNQNEYKY